MSLLGALSNAISGLNAAKSALETVSNNVSNVNTPDYARKSIQLSTRAIPGGAGGVDVKSISRQIDQFISDDLRQAAADADSLSTQSSIASELGHALGSPGDPMDLGVLMQNFQNALARLSAAPADSSLRGALVDAADRLAKGIQKGNSAVENAWQKINAELSTNVEQVNSLLSQLQSLNQQISETRGSGGDSSNIEDRRDAALSELAKLVSINVVERGHGAVTVFAGNGRALLDSDVHPLTYRKSLLPPAPGSSVGSPAPGDVLQDNLVLTEEMRSGRVGGLIAAREQLCLPLRDRLEGLAALLREEVNKLSNLAAGLPGRDTITLTREGGSLAAASVTGKLRVALVDGDGRLGAVADIDCGAGMTGQAILVAIGSSIPELDVASQDPEGRPQIKIRDAQAAQGYTIAFGEIAPTSVTNADGVTGRGFFEFFGVNDLFTGTSARDIAVRRDLSKNPALLNTGQLTKTVITSVNDGGITVQAPPPPGTIGITPADAAALRMLSAALALRLTVSIAPGATQLMTAAEAGSSLVAGLALTTGNLDSEARAAQLTREDIAARASTRSGVNVDQEMGELITYQNAYNAAARVITITSDMYAELTKMIR